MSEQKSISPTIAVQGRPPSNAEPHRPRECCEQTRYWRTQTRCTQLRKSRCTATKRRSGPLSSVAHNLLYGGWLGTSGLEPHLHPPSFNDAVGAVQKLCRDDQSEGACSLQIDHEFTTRDDLEGRV